MQSQDTQVSKSHSDKTELANSGSFYMKIKIDICWSNELADYDDDDLVEIRFLNIAYRGLITVIQLTKEKRRNVKPDFRQLTTSL